MACSDDLADQDRGGYRRRTTTSTVTDAGGHNQNNGNELDSGHSDIDSGVRMDAMDMSDSLEVVAAAFLLEHATSSLVLHEEVVRTAQTLHAKIETFTSSPSAVGLQAVKDAWLISREVYLQTEVYKFYPAATERDTVNAWPIDASYVDYTERNSSTGLINDENFQLNAANILDRNQREGEQSISVGYHVIEFLLWGEDLSDGAGSGERLFTDFVEGGTSLNADRRKQYLKLVGELLVSELESIRDEWKIDGASRRMLIEAETLQGLEQILGAMHVLSVFEISGEQLEVLLATRDPNEEQSPFSDNTRQDIIQSIQGVLNIWLGTYRITELSQEVSLYDVIKIVDTGLADKLDLELKDALAKAESLQDPFDQEIAAQNQAGQARVNALYTALQDLADETLVEIATKLGFELPQI